MRVGFDATILGPSTRYSGIGQYSLKLLNDLADVDGSNEYLLYGPPECPRPAGLHGDLRWKPLSRPPLGKLSAFASFMWSVPRLVETDRLDLFHAPTVHPRASWPPVPRRIRCPLVVTLHDLIPLTYYSQPPHKMPLRSRLFYRWNLRAAVGADLVITVSDASRREILSELSINESRVHTIYNGVNAPSRTQGGAPGRGLFGTDQPYVLYVGSFEPRKNLLRLIRAYTRAVRDGLQCHLAVVADPGSGQTAEVESELASSGLGKSVHFLRGVSEQDLWKIYACADLFVFPSLAEGFGLPPLEAMAAGTPVIASDIPALREVLGDAAYFVDPRSEDDLAFALLELSNNVARRDQLAEAGLSRAGLYTWRDCAEKTLAAYEKVVKERLTCDRVEMRRFEGAGVE